MTNEEYEEILRKREALGDNYFTLLEQVIDTLYEVGNGTTDDDLHEALEKLFRIRDLLEGFKNEI